MLPNLENAQPTLQALAAVTRLLGAARVLAFERQPNFLHLGMKIVPEGVSTDVLPTGGEVRLDMRQLALVYQPAQGAAQSIPLEAQSQADLLEKLLATIYTGELAAFVPHAAGETYTEAIFNAAPNLVNHGKLHRELITDSAPLHFDSYAANDYAQVLYSIFTAVARFRARLYGSMTPVVVWNEHFDLSFIWFAAEPDENRPHLNFGFAPFSAGISEPYLYTYAYPYPETFAPPSLPPGARWHTEGWKGVVLPYSAIAARDDPEGYVESSCIAIYHALRPLLKA
jgi:hypothetical protein